MTDYELSRRGKTKMAIFGQKRVKMSFSRHGVNTNKWSPIRTSDNLLWLVYDSVYDYIYDSIYDYDYVYDYVYDYDYVYNELIVWIVLTVTSKTEQKYGSIP